MRTYNFQFVAQDVPCPKSVKYTFKISIQLNSLNKFEKLDWHKSKTFSDESENPPATNDPSWDIDEQFKLQNSTHKT